ncbi:MULTISPECIES: ABC transporter substrate-binding protein [Actinomycetaceae]|uniref:ABC transporter substrate-binding protein n=1 Tax=Actinomycetaceae TaxID=2049 RepID=UPI0001F11D02|nr:MULTISPECIES: ABC transporter substrate-binding protein [Actinomycetaceae]EFU61279.1 ABC superfamily ATP binding cassette transporter, binding protein [Actinomyces sp. oral taxon 180 str. F0310]UUO93517.1 ABC transporter substrate-binding protein [Schaalia odontolytica]
MRMSKHFATGAALTAAAAMVLTACGGGSSTSNGSGGADASGGPKGTVTAGVAYETTDYGPITTSALGMGANWQVLEGLYRFNMADYSVSPALAAGDPVKVSDTEYEVSLREGAKFSDGTPVTAADVVSSYERATSEKSIYRQFFTFVDSVSAKDDTTVTITLKHPFANLKERFVNVRVVPSSMDEDSLKAKPVGSGPYKYETITATEITAVPNENYTGNEPAKVATLKWQALKDDSARLAAAIGGTIDVMEAVPASTQDQLKNVGWNVESKPGYGNPFMMFNTRKAPFDKPEVRRAFLKAIDKQKLISSALDGQAVEATSFLPEANPAYKKPATDLSYDKAAATKLLSDAGVSGLEINLVTTDHPWVLNLVPQIKSDLEALGVKVNHTQMASSDLYSNVADVDSPTYDVILAPGDPSVFGVDPGIIISWWNGDNVWTKKRDGWQESDPESFAKLQSIMDEAVQLEGDAAKAKWGEAQDLLAEKTVLYPLVFRNMITGSNPKKVDGFQAISSTGLQLLGVSAK